MCLRKSPYRSPALLAANRANSLKSTGPRTRLGKARSSLNALEHGSYACRLPEKLRAAGYGDRAALHQAAYQEICGAFRPEGAEERAQAVRLAGNVVAMAQRARIFGTKPEYALFSARLGPRCSSLFPIRVVDPWSGIGLVFWVQRKAYWTLPKLLATVFGEAQGKGRSLSAYGFRGSAVADTAAPSPNPNRESRTPAKKNCDSADAGQEPPLRLALEGRVRHHVFRVRRLRAGERERGAPSAPPRGRVVDSRLRGNDRLEPRGNDTKEGRNSELEKVKAVIEAAKLMPHECY